MCFDKYIIIQMQNFSDQQKKIKAKFKKKNKKKKKKMYRSLHFNLETT